MSERRVDAPARTKELEAFMERIGRGVAALANVGEVQIGATPKDEVWREDKVVLYRYRPVDPAGAEAPIRTPLLICYALVNRPYMMDLEPNRSLIRGLTQRGVDVYLIDWGYPDGADRYLAMEDYILRYLPHCVDEVLRRGGCRSLNLLGVCQGGTLSLCYAALFPSSVRNLITMVTPVDFRTPENLLAKWVQGVDVDALTATLGNVPGELLNAVFLALAPFRLTSQKYVGLLDQIDDPGAVASFVRMEKWIFDSPDQPGQMFREFVTWFYKENRLVAGATEIGGRAVDLGRVTMPVLNIYALQDHLVPPSASAPLRRLVGSADYSEHEFRGGHIGIYVSSAAQREIPERIAGWLRERDR